MNPANEGPLERTQAQRVFAAMRDIDEFTVSQLVHSSGVNPDTVRTVLLRNSEFLEEVGRQETGRRGGQFRKYRLTDAGRAYVDSHLPPALERRLGADPSRTWVDGSPFVPEGLRAAQDTLTSRLQTVDGQASREFLLRLADVDLWSAAADIEAAADAGHDVTIAKALLHDLRLRHSSLVSAHEVLDVAAARGNAATQTPVEADDVERLMMDLATRVAAEASSSNRLPLKSMRAAAEEFGRLARSPVRQTAGAEREKAIVARLNSRIDTLPLDTADIWCVGIGAAIYAPGVLRTVRRPSAQAWARDRDGATKGASLAINIPKYLDVVGEIDRGPSLAPVERQLHAQMRERVARCW